MKDINNKIIVCITGDIDYFVEETIECLKEYFSILNKYQIKATFFVTASAAEKYPERLEYILRNSHEVEGHGDIHEAFYGSIQKQIVRLEKMKNIFSILFDLDIMGFRAPWYKHNNNTYHALNEAGLKYDCSKKRFEIAFKAIPYVQKTYMYTKTYRFTKPVLRLIADLYNHYHNAHHRYPYYVNPNVLEIPTLGISDYTLIDDPNGPKYSPSDYYKVGEILVECLYELQKRGGGILNLQAHPGRISPDYLASLDQFIYRAIKLGATFSTTGIIARAIK